MTGIYKITNLINGKIYIGQSRNIEERWKAHRCRPFNPNSNDYQNPLYRAIRKYGLMNFSFEVVEQCSIDDLDEKEIAWIKNTDSTNPEIGYNLTQGGATVVPHKLTEEQRDQIINYLANSTKMQEEIAKEFDISQRLVSGINLGEYWIKQDVRYPIRKTEGQKNHCLMCGKEITSTSTLCIDCNGLAHRKADRPNREELKSLIRTTPFTKIGKMFNVSDNAIRRWCKSENLPTRSSDIKRYTPEEWELI